MPHSISGREGNAIHGELQYVHAKAQSPLQHIYDMFTLVRKPTLAATLLSAVLFPLALPNELFPMGNPFIGLIALAPLYVALREAESPRQATLAGVLFGGISTFLANYWLMFFGEYSVWTIGGTTVGYMLYNAILGPFLWRALRARPAYRPILFALVWTGYEFLKSVGFLAYPWGLAAYPFNMVSVLVQVVDVTGVWGLTLVVVYANALVAEGALILADRRSTDARSAGRNAVFCALLAGLIVTYGVVMINRDIPARGSLRVLLVQQNADSWNTRDVAGPLLTAQQLTRAGLAEMPDPDLIVWSETSLRFLYNSDYGRDWYDRNPSREPFTQFVSRLPAPLMTGSPVQGEGGEFTVHNAVLLLDQDGSIVQWYGKQHLVPFAEHVPYWESAAVQRFFQEVVGIQAIWAPGPGVELFRIERAGSDPVLAGTPICFEDGFSYMGRRFVLAGADVLINLTNNAWSRTDSAQLQHLVAARFRAVETRRSLVRSTNAGYTGVVDPWGRVVSGLPMFTGGYLAVDVPVYSPGSSTVYVMWGDYLPIVILAGLVLLLLRSHVDGRRRGD